MELENTDQPVSGESSFKLISVLTTPRINPGDDVEVQYFFTGAGYPIEHPPTRAKIYVNFAGLEADSDISVVQSIQGGFDEISEQYIAITGSQALKEQKIPVDFPSFVYGLGKHFFVEANPDEGSSEDSIPPILSETTHAGYPPLSITIATAADQPPGDYEIQSVLTYFQRDSVATDESILTVHVNNWVERNEKTLKVAGVLIATFGVLLAFVSFGLDIYEALFATFRAGLLSPP